MKKTTLVLMAMAAMMALASCGGNPIVGKWIIHDAKEDGDAADKKGSTNESYTFMKDGTVERYYEEDDDGDKTRYVYQGNWKYEEPVVIISLGKRGKMNSADVVGEYKDLNSEMVRYGVYNSKTKMLGISMFVAEKSNNVASEFAENGAWKWDSYWGKIKITNTIHLQRWPKGAQTAENQLDGQASYTSAFWGDSTDYNGYYLIRTDKTSKGDVSEIAFMARSSENNTYTFGGDLYGSKLYVRELLLKKAK